MLTEREQASRRLYQYLDELRETDHAIWTAKQCREAVWQFVECSGVAATDESPALLSTLYEVQSDPHCVYSLTLSVLLDCTLHREETGARLLECAQGRVELSAVAKKRPLVVKLPRLDTEYYVGIAQQRMAQRELEGGAIQDEAKAALVRALYVTQLKYATSDQCALRLATPFRSKVANILGHRHACALFGATDEETARHIRCSAVYIVEGQEFVNGLSSQ